MICLAAGSIGASLALSAFTLAWQHSIEKIRWEEDWQVLGGKLVVVSARIRGSGAGMEIPPDARLSNGVWHYRPGTPPLPRLRLAHSPFAAGYELCLAGSCKLLADYLPSLDVHDIIEISPCPN